MTDKSEIPDQGTAPHPRARSTPSWPTTAPSCSRVPPEPLRAPRPSAACASNKPQSLRAKEEFHALKHTGPVLLQRHRAPHPPPARLDENPAHPAPGE